MSVPNPFQGSPLEIDNPQSREEDEELEEQRRRQEELADLLADGIHAFNYDESTINSSITSCEGADTHYNEPSSIKNPLQFKYDDTTKTSLVNMSDDAIEKNYREAAPQEQLKVLYEVRMREISNLREEYSKYQADKNKEINLLKHKVTLSEAEIRHFQLSLTNLESLLVEKTDTIKAFKLDIQSKDQELETLKKLNEQLKLEICSYSSTVTELQLKLTDNNPFNTGAKHYKSEELQKAHQDQIVKLETLLQEQTSKNQQLEKENSRLDESLRKLVLSKKETDDENNFTIMSLSKKLQSSQQQCKDLFVLGEAIKKESDHFKERLNQQDANFDISFNNLKNKSMDKDTMLVHMEKLKRMLLDKDVELNTLQAKLKFYNSDLDELFRYRKIVEDLYNSEIKSCSNSEHAELLIFTQRQLQTYQQAVEDRNHQILNLNMVNKELEGKIEEMIQQTRNDIQNLSEKYSLPQLETMSNELKNAENTINDLKAQIADKTNELQKALQQNDHIQQMARNEKQNLEEMMALLKRDLELSDLEITRLRKSIEELKKTEENLEEIAKFTSMTKQDAGEDSESELKSLNLKYGAVQNQLHQVAEQLSKSRSSQENPNNRNIKLLIALANDVRAYQTNAANPEVTKKLTNWLELLEQYINNSKDMKLEDSHFRALEEVVNAKMVLEEEKGALENELKNKVEELEAAKHKYNALMREFEVGKLKFTKDVSDLESRLKAVEKSKADLEAELEVLQRQLNVAKEESDKLRREIGSGENVRRSLFKELKEVENVLEQSRGENDVSGTDFFQKSLQAEILKAELVLRDLLQTEYNLKITNIEGQYKNALAQKSEVYNKEKESWKRKEINYNKNIASVLEECGKKMIQLENENIMLAKRIANLVNDYNAFKNNALNCIEKHKNMIVESRKESQEITEKWEALLEFCTDKFSTTEKNHKKRMKSLITKMNTHENQMDMIQRIYDEKIKQLKLKTSSV